MEQLEQSVIGQQTLDIIRGFVCEKFLYDRPGLVPTDDFPLIQQRVIDSLQIIQLISFLEERFAIRIDIRDLVLENFTSLTTITALVEKQREGY